MNLFNLYTDIEADSEGYDVGLVSLLTIAVGIVLFAVCNVLELNPIFTLVMSILSVLVTSFNIFKAAFVNFSNRRIISEALVIAIAIICTLAIQEFKTGFAISILYQIIKFAETIVRDRKRVKAYDILNILPDTAKILEDDSKITRKAIHIQPGDVILLEKDDIVPVDGRVLEGFSAVDYSLLTRVSKSEAVSVDSELISGSVNKDSSIIMEAEDSYSESTAQRIFRSFKSSMKKPGKREDFISTLFRIYTPVLLLIFIIVSFIAPIFTKDWNAGIRSGVVILLCACPIGLLSMLSLSVFCGVERIFSSGSVIKDSRIIDRIAKTESFICNKTAVLTEKEYYIIDIKPKGISEEGLVSLVNAVEAGSDHPIAVALRRYSGIEKKETPDDLKFTEIPGKGITAYVGDNIVYAGNAVMLFDHGIQCTVPDMPGVALHVAVNNNYCGYILFENRLRQDIYNPIERLRACGLKRFILLSSDLRSIVRPIAGSLNFDTVKSELTPENKASSVEYLMNNKNKGSMMMFAGNGCDELVPASKADISVCLDAMRNDDAIESSDVSILGENLNALPDVVDSSKKCVRRCDIDIAVSLGVRLICLLMLLFGVKLILPALILIFASSAFCIVNGALDKV